MTEGERAEIMASLGSDAERAEFDLMSEEEIVLRCQIFGYMLPIIRKQDLPAAYHKFLTDPKTSIRHAMKQRVYELRDQRRRSAGTLSVPDLTTRYGLDFWSYIGCYGKISPIKERRTVRADTVTETDEPVGGYERLPIKGRRPHPLRDAGQEFFSPLTIAVSRQPNFPAVSKDNTPSTGTLSIRDQFMSTDRFEAQVRLSKRPVHTVERTRVGDALKDLRCPDFFLMDDWWADCQMQCNWQKADPDMVKFWRAYRHELRVVQAIPVFISDILSDDTIEIAHCHYFRNLRAMHWQALRWVGDDVAARLSNKVMSFDDAPGYWGLAKWRLS